METQIYWLAADPLLKLGIMARPRGGDWLEDEVQSLSKQGVAVVASLLTNEESEELGLSKEAEFCERYGIRFTSFPIEDRGVPATDIGTQNFIRLLANALGKGEPIVIHCRMGVGRAPLIAAACMVLLGQSPDAAFRQVALARGCVVPETPEQRDWLHRFSDYLSKSR